MALRILELYQLFDKGNLKSFHLLKQQHDFYKFLQLRHFLESLLKDNRIAFIFLISYRKTIPFFNFLQKEDFCFLYYIV